MLKAVIFDLDGVVADSHPVHLKAWKQFFASIRVSIPDADLDYILDGRKREDILRHYLGELTAAQVEEYGRCKEEFFREEAAQVGPIRGVAEFLARLRDTGVASAVASSGARARVQFLLQKLGLRSYFSAVVTSEDVRFSKPDPAIFALAAAKMQCDGRELVVVEDAVAGVQAAKAAGMKCVGVAGNGRRDALRQAGADDVIPDFLNVDVARFAKLLD